MNLVTLTTDFGTEDYFVGAMKGAILTVNPAAAIVDITHDLPAHDVSAGAFTLFAACQTFPLGTIHLAVVDPGVGSVRRPILAVSDRYSFVAPDNGLLNLIYEREANLRVFHLNNDRFFRQPVSATFHGRDVFAPVAGALSRGVSPAELGTEIEDFVRFKIEEPKQIDKSTIETKVLHIDRFGNCLLNLTQKDWPANFEGKQFWVEINNQKIDKLQNFYAEANQIGDVFLIFGSAGLLEIVAFQASAAELVDINVGQPLLIKTKSSE